MPCSDSQVRALKVGERRQSKSVGDSPIPRLEVRMVNRVVQFGRSVFSTALNELGYGRSGAVASSKSTH